MVGPQRITFLSAVFVIHKDFAIIAIATTRKTMGKGDKKTKKGKIRKDSYGNSRNRKALKARLKRAASSKPKAAVAEVEEKPKKTAKKKADA